MKKWTKVLTVVLCAVLLVTASVMATIAVMVVKTDTVTNTFTIGNITLTLDEAKVSDNGVPVEGAARVMQNEYKLFEGKTYTKDPTVHVGAGSEACYLFVVVENGILNIETTEANKTIKEQIVSNGWQELENGIYYRTHAYNDAAKDYPVFGEFTVASNVSVDDLMNYQNATISITAYAVQSADVADVTAAWELVSDIN